MFTHLDILKVMTCLVVIGLAAAPAYAQQSAQQPPCNQQNAANCMQMHSNADPKGGIGITGPYDHTNTFEPGDGQHTQTNPLNNNKPTSGN